MDQGNSNWETHAQEEAGSDLALDDIGRPSKLLETIAVTVVFFDGFYKRLYRFYMVLQHCPCPSLTPPLKRTGSSMISVRRL